MLPCVCFLENTHDVLSCWCHFTNICWIDFEDSIKLNGFSFIPSLRLPHGEVTDGKTTTPTTTIVVFICSSTYIPICYQETWIWVAICLLMSPHVDLGPIPSDVFHSSTLRGLFASPQASSLRCSSGDMWSSTLTACTMRSSQSMFTQGGLPKLQRTYDVSVLKWAPARWSGGRASALISHWETFSEGEGEVCWKNSFHLVYQF